MLSFAEVAKERKGGWFKQIQSYLLQKTVKLYNKQDAGGRVLKYM